jgi:hypothetical protein
MAAVLAKVVSPIVVEVPDTSKAANMTPLIVVAGTPVSPTLKALSKLPAVITSVSPEMVVAGPQVMVAARAESESSTLINPTMEKIITVFNEAHVRENRILLGLWQSIFVFIGVSTLVLAIASGGRLSPELRMLSRAGAFGVETSG